MITYSPRPLPQRQTIVEHAYRHNRTVVAHVDASTRRDDLDRSFYVFTTREAAESFAQQDNSLRVHR